MINLDDVVVGYLECQLWAGLDYREEGEEPVHYDENYSVSDLAEEYVAAVREELAEVIRLHPIATRMYLARINPRGLVGDFSELFGHDFYLTREHHGAGFWDRGLGELGGYLTEIAHSYGSAADLFDDGSGVLRAS